MPRVELLTQNGRPVGQLESKLRHLVIGQEEAIQQIVRAYQTYLAGLSPVGWPIANFLFLGPTGSGKTRIVVATAESLLQNSRAVIKVDCAEFQHSHEIAKLSGSHLKRAIERLLVQALSNLMASGQIHGGDCIRVSHEDGSAALVFGRESETVQAWAAAGCAA
ncbi:MAG TPA: AAA family ATPase [Edaphobacter sp.]|nr:AAA family ATPase [Edaphobacter sp.]